MAIISGDSLNIDIVKLKQDLEQSGVLKVLSINPTATGFDCEIINAENFSTTLTTEELQLAESIISAHQDQQKRKLQVKTSATEVYDATNKLFVDNKINDIIGPNANAALDTLMELSTALNNDSNFATTLATQINQIQSNITSLENDVESLQQADQLLANNIQQGDESISISLTTEIQSLNNLLESEITYRELGDVALENQINNISTNLAPIALSGSYTDLSNTPLLFSGSFIDLTDKYAILEYLSENCTLDVIRNLSVGAPQEGSVLRFHEGIGYNNEGEWHADVLSYSDIANTPTIPSNITDFNDVEISEATKGQFLVHDGTQFVNSNTIEADTSSSKPVIIKAAESQTANLLEVQASNGAIIAGVDASGNLISPTITNLQQGLISFPGAIIAYGGALAPSGWLMCNGQSYLIADYQTLYNVIGTSYNINGDGLSLPTGHFRVPDLRRRVPTGKGSTDNLGSNDGNTSASRSLTHSHTVTVPGHYHDMSGAGSTLAVDIAHSHSGSSVTGTITLNNTNLAHTHSGTTGTGNSIFYRVVHAAGTQSSHNHVTGYDGWNGFNDRADADWPASDHTHSFTTGGASASMDHTHTVSSISLTAAGQSLSATSKTPTGSIGKVTGGVNGNSDQALSSTITNNNNYLIVNYIIKT